MHRALCRSGVFPHTAAAVPRDAGNGGKRRSMSDAPYRHDRRKHLHGERKRGYGYGASCAGCRADGGVCARKPGDPHRPVFYPQPADGAAAGRDPYLDPHSETKEHRLRRGVYEARETAGPRDRNAEYRRAHRHRPRRDDLRGPLAPTPVRLYESEKILLGAGATPEEMEPVLRRVEEKLLTEIQPRNSLRASREYRESTAPVALTRTIRRACGREETL